MRFDHVKALSLFVEDVASSKTFYREVFGVDTVFEDEVSAAFKFGDLILNLLAVGSAPEIIEPGVVAPAGVGSRFQITLWVPDVDQAAEELERRGVQILAGPKDRPWGVRTLNFVDPSGHSFEIAQPIKR
jgi:catechol 2,3-dioxygenase-like lactoylglutathione lyase family enzyme